MRERYWGAWPSLAGLTALPPGSLGHAYGHLLADQGLEPLPAPQIPAAADGDDADLHSRIRAYHDVWHPICGCPTSLAGEAALNGVSAEQLRWPGGGSRGGCGAGDRPRAGARLPGAAPAGPALGGRLGTAPGSWREALGIGALVSRSPFAAPC